VSLEQLQPMSTDNRAFKTLSDALSEEERRLFHSYVLILNERVVFLPDKPAETAASTVAALWHTACGAPYSVDVATTRPLPALSTEGKGRLGNLVARRSAGVPLAHLSGRQHFMGLEMLADAAALIPRKETELLGRAVLTMLQDVLAHQTSAVVIDLCTGSGNLALAIAAHEARATVFASDLSNEAVALARRNTQHLSLDARVTILQGDLLAPFDQPQFLGQVDALVCNPPYISSSKVELMAQEIADHEPRLAFDGGPLGISILMRLIAEAPRYLRAGGLLAFEIGAGQGRGIRRRLEQGAHFASIHEVTDTSGQVRAFLAKCPR
jgi:release factor glutamine methyltransferase